MRIPIEWLKDYIKIEKTPYEIAASFTALGLMLDKPYNEQEGVLDLEHRMDRADWLSILGCARDLAAFENVPLVQPQLYTKPGKKPAQNQIIKIEVTCPEFVNRFNTRVFRGVKVTKSPEWLKTRLESYGIPSLNNIVDITNYVMVELGQTMHAQDLAKLEKPEIILRRARVGETIETFLGETSELDTDMFVLTQNDRPTVIGGIVGGKETGVDDTTTDIVLDAGNYNQTNIRKTSRKLKVQNESVMRNDKFLHPELTEIALQRATKLILDLAGGTFYENADWYPKKQAPKVMQVRLSRIKLLSGLNIELGHAAKILQNLEYKIIRKSKDAIQVQVPYFRTDVEVEDDLVADVLRINNYEKIPSAIISAAPPKEITEAIYNFEDRIRNILASLGAHEHISDPFVSANPKLPDQVTLENSLNSEKPSLRTYLYDTLKPMLENYHKNKITKATLFEVGKTYHCNGNPNNYENYNEKRVVQVIYADTASSIPENLNSVKALLGGLLYNLGIEGATYTKSDGGAKIVAGGTCLGYLRADSFYLYTEELLKVTKTPRRVITGIENNSFEHFSILAGSEDPLGPIVSGIQDLDTTIVGVAVKEIRTGDDVPAGKKSVLLEVTFTSPVDETLRKQIVATLQEKFGAEQKRVDASKRR